MKTFIAAVLVSSMGSAFAAEKLCYDINLSFNTHPHRECPSLKSFCLDSLHGKMTLTMESGEVEVLKFTGQHVVNYSDVGQDIFDSYDSANMSLDLSHNNNGNWPATITEGFKDISLSTGVNESSGVYVSQTCYYDLR